MTLRSLFTMDAASKPMTNGFAQNMPVYLPLLFPYIDPTTGVNPATDKFRALFDISWTTEDTYNTWTGRVHWKGQMIPGSDKMQARPRPFFAVTTPQVYDASRHSVGTYGNLMCVIPNPVKGVTGEVPTEGLTQMVAGGVAEEVAGNMRGANWNKYNVNPTSMIHKDSWSKWISSARVDCHPPSPHAKDVDEFGRDKNSYQMMKVCQAFQYAGLEGSITTDAFLRHNLSVFTKMLKIDRALLISGSYPRPSMDSLLHNMIETETLFGGRQAKRISKKDPKTGMDVFEYSSTEFVDGTESFKIKAARLFVDDGKFNFAQSKAAQEAERNLPDPPCLLFNGKSVGLRAGIKMLRSANDKPLRMVMPVYRLLVVTMSPQNRPVFTFKTITSHEADRLLPSYVVSYVVGIENKPNPGRPFSGHVDAVLKQVLLLGPAVNPRPVFQGTNNELVFETAPEDEALLAQARIISHNNNTMAFISSQMGGVSRPVKRARPEGSVFDQDDDEEEQLMLAMAEIEGGTTGHQHKAQKTAAETPSSRQE